jgi:hypothetical protein
MKSGVCITSCFAPAPATCSNVSLIVSGSHAGKKDTVVQDLDKHAVCVVCAGAAGWSSPMCIGCTCTAKRWGKRSSCPSLQLPSSRCRASSSSSNSSNRPRRTSYTHTSGKAPFGGMGKSVNGVLQQGPQPAAAWRAVESVLPLCWTA